MLDYNLTSLHQQGVKPCSLSLYHAPISFCLWQFDALLENALQMGADKLATGHYARLWQPQSGGPVQLLRGIDENKDQSYFLANVVWSRLRCSGFC